jgi:hypothetical protein
MYDNDGSAKILCGRGDDSVSIASVAAHVPIKRGQGSNLADAERDANAHLIAAAPALYEALEQLFADYKALADSGDAGNWSLEDTAQGKRAMAALAQARGEQP